MVSSGQELLALNKKLQEDSLLEVASVGSLSSFESVALSENAASEVVVERDVDPIRAFMDAEAEKAVESGEFELLENECGAGKTMSSLEERKDLVLLAASDVESVVTSRTEPELEANPATTDQPSTKPDSSTSAPIETEYLGCHLRGSGLTPPCSESVEELKQIVEGVPSPGVNGHCILLGKLEQESSTPKAENVIKAYIRNNGESAWPEDLCLRLVHGSGLGGSHLPLAGLRPGEVAEIVLPVEKSSSKSSPDLGTCRSDQFSIFCLTNDKWVVGKDMYAIAY